MTLSVRMRVVVCRVISFGYSVTTIVHSLELDSPHRRRRHHSARIGVERNIGSLVVTPVEIPNIRQEML